MISQEVRFDGLERLTASYSAAPLIVHEELRRLAAEVALEMREKIQDATPTAHGTLRKSISEDVIPLPDGIGVEAVAGSSLNYAPWVELGTRPHMPPLEPLVDWVKAKGLDLGLVGTSAKARKRRDEVAVEIAQRIRWAIYQRGTEGQHMFKKGFEQATAGLGARVGAAIERVGARIAGGQG
jgi:hypothetical protein